MHNEIPPTVSSKRIKEKKVYSEDGIDDDEIEGKRTYSVDEKLKSGRYNKDYVQILKGEEFNLKYLQENGLEKPIIFYEKTGLGLRVPSENFKVSDVKQCVGSRRMLDVMDVNTQKGIEMSMRDWVQYYENTERSRLLNVISLEFSHTKLENYVESPTLVRQIDWVDTVWPRHYKDCQTESTNIIDKMKYPKVQKYCLMSVKGCYTDFHVDFGGTSVWYHILHGEKVFWLIPPTPKNMEIYLNWVLSGKQGDIFLADKVDGCQRITLYAGYTFIIPSGWIHGVYTPEDSLVFGGNFLHNYNMENQLRVSEIEDRTHVPQKFRYPFYAEIAWYVLAQYLCCLTGKQYVELPSENMDDEKTEQDDSRPSSRCSQENGQTEMKNSPDIGGNSSLSKSIKIELTRIDSQTMKKSPSTDDEKLSAKQKCSPRKSSSDSCSSADTEIYERTDDVAAHHGEIDFSNVTKELTSKASRLKMNEDSNSSGSIDLKRPKREHKNVHLTQFEIRGLKKMIAWLEDLPPSKKGIPKDLIDAEVLLRDAKQLVIDHLNDDPKLAITGEPVITWPPSKKVTKPKRQYTTSGQKAPKAVKGKLQKSEVVRRRRTRCKKCEPCTRSDCGECNFCKDMKKFGGSGRMKQCCKSKQCLSPVLPHNATCLICNKPDQPEPNQLMECSMCWEIVHVPCLQQKYENLNNEGVVNEDVRQQWECPKCTHDTTQGQLQLRVKDEVKKEDMVPISAALTVDVKNTPKEHEGKRVTAKEQMHSPISYASETDLDEMALEMECYDDAANLPQKAAVESQEPAKIIKTGMRKKLSPKKRLSNGVKQKKTPRGVMKQRSPLKMKKSVTNVKPSPITKTQLKPSIDGEGDVESDLQPTLTNQPETPTGDCEKTNGIDKTPESVKTRSGRTIKRSPTLSDENMTSDPVAKRPRREALTSPRGRRLYGFKKFRSAGSKVRKKLQTDELDLVENVLPDDIPSTSYVEHGSNQTPSRSGFRGQGQGRRKRRLVESGPSNNDVHGQNRLFWPGRREVTPDVALPPKIEPPKDIKRYVIRPPPPPPPADYFVMNNGRNHPVCREIWMKIYSYLDSTSLVKCLACCKTWYRWCMHHTLWKTIDLSGKYIYQFHLIGIVKRQPATLILRSSKLTHKQLAWLLARIPQLKSLSLSSCSWAVVSALGFAICPLLHSLDISWVMMSDEQFQDLIRPPADRHPGMVDISRLHKLKHLSVAGTEISNSSLSEIPNHLTSLEKLDISYCSRITDEGICRLLLPGNPITQSLIALDISGCNKVTDRAGDSFQHCTQLQTVKMASSQHISSKIRKKCPVVSFMTDPSFQIV